MNLLVLVSGGKLTGAICLFQVTGATTTVSDAVSASVDIFCVIKANIVVWPLPSVIRLGAAVEAAVCNSA